MKFLTMTTVMMMIVFAMSANAADPTGEPEYKQPVIKDHGGIVVLPDAAHQPKKNSKVILDITYMTDLGKTKNPNLELIGQLKKAGVEIFVCGQALAHHSYATSEVAPGVKVAVSAATVNINLQMDGYAYIPFK